MEAPLFFWSQAKSAEQLISKIIFPTQYSDVTALIKNERASPQNAKLKIFLRVKLYLKSETNFFSLLVFTGSQGSKNWRRARHHDATFMMKTKRYKKEDDTLLFFPCWAGGLPSRESNHWFFFLGFSWNLVRDPCRANLNSKLQPAFEIPGHMQ